MDYFAPFNRALEGASEQSNNQLAQAYKLHDFETKQRAAKLQYEAQKLAYDDVKRKHELETEARTAATSAQPQTTDNPAYAQFQAASQGPPQMEPVLPPVNDYAGLDRTYESQYPTQGAQAPPQTIETPANKIKVYLDTIAAKDPTAAMEMKGKLFTEFAKTVPSGVSERDKITHFNQLFGDDWQAVQNKKDLMAVKRNEKIIDPLTGKVVFDNTQDANQYGDIEYITLKNGKQVALIRDENGRAQVIGQDAPRVEVKVGGGGGGKPPAGYRFTPNGNLEAIPGGPADQKQETAAQAKENNIATINSTVAAIDRLTSHPGRQAATGLSSKIDPRNYVPGTDAADFQRELESFDSQLFLASIAKMKGMGALSDAEGKKISAAAGAIKPGMSEEAFLKNMKIIRDGLEDAKTRVRSSGGSRPQPPAGRKTSADPMGIL